MVDAARLRARLRDLGAYAQREEKQYLADAQAVDASKYRLLTAIDLENARKNVGIAGTF